MFYLLWLGYIMFTLMHMLINLNRYLCVMADVGAMNKSTQSQRTLIDSWGGKSRGGRMEDWSMRVCLPRKEDVTASAYSDTKIRKLVTHGGKKYINWVQKYWKNTNVNGIFWQICVFFFFSDMTWTLSHLFLNHRACFHSDFMDVAKQQHQIQWGHEWKSNNKRVHFLGATPVSEWAQTRRLGNACFGRICAWAWTMNYHTTQTISL